MLTDNFYLETERLQIVPFDYQYLQNYAEEFTEEIARLQYPDPFSSIDAAKQVVDELVNEMHQGRMLELLILSKSGEFPVSYTHLRRQLKICCWKLSI